MILFILIYLNNTQFGEIVRRFKAIGSRRASWVRQKRAETTRKIGPAFPGAIIEALVLPFLRFYVTTVIRPFQNFQYWPKSFETARSWCFITTYRLNFDHLRLFLFSMFTLRQKHDCSVGVWRYSFNDVSKECQVNIAVITKS